MKKTFDCLEMKRKIYSQLWSESGAKNIGEYVNYLKDSIEKQRKEGKNHTEKKIVS